MLVECKKPSSPFLKNDYGKVKINMQEE